MITAAGMARIAAPCALVAVLLPASALAETSVAPAACTPISTIQQLSDIRKKLDGNYCLTRNLNAQGFRGFKPIGDPIHPLTNPFRGTFDGRGHTISNLTIISNYGEEALFMSVRRRGVIKNLKLVNINVTRTAVGGHVGTLAGTMTQSAVVTNVSATGSAKGKATAFVGGLIGRKEGGTLSKCSSRANVFGTDGWVGGLLGAQWGGTTFECFATGTVNSGNASNAGGFVGVNINRALIRDFAAYGKVISRSGSSYFGGFVGLNDGPLERVFAIGAVQVAGRLATLGALIGNATVRGKVNQAYAVGKLTSGQFPTIGGLIGFSPDDTAGNDVIIVRSGYWNTTTTGQTVSSGGGLGKTTAQLKAGLPAGFSGAHWGIRAGTYPFLKKLVGAPLPK